MSVRRRSGPRYATYDDILAASPTVVAEIVDGELHTTPRHALRELYEARVMTARALGLERPFDG